MRKKMTPEERKVAEAKRIEKIVKQNKKRAIKYDPDVAKQVQAMSTYGLAQDKISLIVGIHHETLAKLYANELARGHALANLGVGKRLYEKCMSGDTASLIFWSKARMGWREKERKNEQSSAPIDSSAALIEAMKEAYKSVGL